MLPSKMTSDSPLRVSVNMESRVRKATMDDLGRGVHFEAYMRALGRIMLMGVSRSTYAQIMDGAPLSQTLASMPGRPLGDHPIYKHFELCDGVDEKVEQILDMSNLHILQFNFDLIRRFLAASPGSKAYKAGLIELMAVSVHQIAAYIYKLGLDVGSHKGLLKADGEAPTLFIHSQYKDIEQYPDGVADAVGYWAEAQIFGGVVLFDRRQEIDTSENREEDCFLPWNRGEVAKRNLQHLDPDQWEHFEWLLAQYRALQQPLQDPFDIYFHSNNEDVTYRIWRLLPEQKKDLFEFLSSDTEAATSPLPILPSEKNLFRIDPEDPISETRICRDIWERKPLGDNDGDARAHHCRGDTVEYPCPTDEERSKGRGFFRKELIFEIQLLESRAQRLAIARAQGAQSDLPPTQD